MATDGETLRALISAGEPDRMAVELWQHELVHSFVTQAFGELPEWLLEGMANYYSTVEVIDENIRIGSDLRNLQFHMSANWIRNTDPTKPSVLAPSSQAIAPSELITSKFSTYHAALQHADLRFDIKSDSTLYQLSTWTFVHMMMSGVKPHASALYEAMAEAEGAGNLGALLTAKLASIGWQTVDDAFYQHMARRETKFWLRNFVAPTLGLVEPRPPHSGDPLAGEAVNRPER